ncbi:WLM domain-containing protein [Chaetomidium leptoderma]|uniref:WLM domain-containing protein n=1 Tax=Chaetomidium leptoderma TaxID=669021 RepID=A0AAN6VKD9_9PEZI|nr:WLM domain-containing protein [Chaetomidium leptoderma]
MSREVDPAILSFTHLKQYPRQDEALHFLKRIASLVKPLMRARGWKVKSLSEMHPDQANLLGLNVNKGEQILLRLREPFDRTQFLPFEKMVDTMLHELAHIVHGPHDHKFNALWDQLRDELDGLMMKGYTGEGFLSKGHRVGGWNIPPDEARRLARAEAERRKPAPGSRGHRLGGTGPQPAGDLRNAILNSIERRNRTELGCANNNHTEREIQAISQAWTRNGFRTQAEEDAANEAAIAQALWELVQEEKRKDGNLDTERPPPIPTATRPPPRPRSPELRDYWTCNLCTLHNPTHAATCDACRSPRPVGQSRNGPSEVIDLTDSPPRKRPKPAPSGTVPSSTVPSSTVPSSTTAPPPVPPQPAIWQCSFCGKVMESQWWTCSLCGKMKDKS